MCLHAIIEGRVQGVGFRAFSQREGIKCKLTGWVRNRWDGSVEVVAEGSIQDLEKFLHALQHGPFIGTTRHLKTEWRDATGDFNTFRIRMTR